MDNADSQLNEQDSSVDRKVTVTALLILGFIGYALLFGFILMGLAISGKSAWYGIYIPFTAIPGALLGPLVLYFLKRRSPNHSDRK